jgi:diguanylate cyclase (GGDEF)-like protein
MALRGLTGRSLPLTRDLEPRAAAAVKLALGLTVMTTVVYALYVALGRHWGPTADPVFNPWVFSGLVVAAGGICVARAAQVEADRAAWFALGAGMLLWALGSVYWSVFLEHLEAPPHPSVADGLHLAFYPCAYAALMMLARRRMNGIGTSVWLDGLTGACAVGAIGAAFVVPAVVAGTDDGTAVVLTRLAYPLGDLLLIAMTLGLFVIRRGRGVLLIGGGIALLAIADTIYLGRVANGTFVEGTLLDALWPAGMVMVALAAWQRPPHRNAFSLEGWAVLLVPFVFTLGSLGVLVNGNVNEMNLVAMALAAATVVAVLLRLALSFHDVRALNESRRQATTDELTGLGNRRLLYERLDEAITRARREHSATTLLLADLDRFKELNDTLGHQAGDILLRQLGPRLLDALRADDTLVRLGGDEFGILLPGRDSEESLEVVDRVRAVLDRGFSIRGLTVHIEASIGVASFPEHAGAVDELLQRVDVAMYQAKSSKVGYQVYAPDRDLHSRDRLSLLGDLRRALSAGELVLHYQPKGVLATGEIKGVEALLRWEHPERGLLPPGMFLPLVEQTGLMRPLTLYVLEDALRQCRAWLDEGLDLSVAVNLSVPNLLDLRLPDDVAWLLGKTRVGPQRLQLEVTENIVTADPSRVIEVLAKLKLLGVGISLDDFGAGSSSLTYLKQLPVDEIKIDRSFVLGMDTSREDAAIVRSATELAQRLGLRVVAEGVETAKSWNHLTAYGCEEAQGYYLQRPVPPDQLGAWLAARARRNGHLPGLVAGDPRGAARLYPARMRRA